jgi:hypothetical protein
MNENQLAKPRMPGIKNFSFLDPGGRYVVESYNDARTHLSLNKDAPSSRAVQAVAVSCPPDTSEVCTINTFEFDFR